MTNPKQPDMVEVIARAICIADGDCENCAKVCELYVEYAQAALTAISPSLRAQRDAEIIQWLRSMAKDLETYAWAYRSRMSLLAAADALESGEV